MRRSLVLLALATGLAHPSEAGAEGACRVTVFGRRDAGGLDTEALIREARERCRPGQTITVHAHRGVAVRREEAAAVVCEDGQPLVLQYGPTPWAGTCRYRGERPVP